MTEGEGNDPGGIHDGQPAHAVAYHRDRDRCAADRVVGADGSQGRNLIVAVGRQFEVTLGTLGPGEYASPPGISSSSVHFIDMSYVGPAIASGPTQLFRFRAVTPGIAIISFRHTGDNPRVEDGVVVY